MTEGRGATNRWSVSDTSATELPSVAAGTHASTAGMGLPTTAPTTELPRAATSSAGMRSTAAAKGLRSASTGPRHSSSTWTVLATATLLPSTAATGTVPSACATGTPATGLPFTPSFFARLTSAPAATVSSDSSAAGDQEGRTEPEGNKTGDGDFPETFHGGILE